MCPMSLRHAGSNDLCVKKVTVVKYEGQLFKCINGIHLDSSTFWPFALNEPEMAGAGTDIHACG